MADDGNPEDALPIKKTSNTAYIAGGVGLVVVLGLVFGMGGGDEEDAKAKAEQTEKAADESQGMTKAEAQERAAHLKKTQAALIAAAADDQAEEQKKNAAEAAQAEEKQAAAKPKSGPAPKPRVNTKKTMNSLDGLGADITAGLK